MSEITLQEAKTRTVTETLISCMEDFGEDEPMDVIVIYTTKSGDICWSANTDSITKKLGLVEFARSLILARGLRQGRA